MKNSLIIILLITVLSGCSTKIIERGEISAGGEVRFSMKEVTDEMVIERNKILQTDEYKISEEEIKSLVRKTNIELLKEEKEKWDKLLKDYKGINIPEYDVLYFKKEFIPTDFELYTFRRMDNYHYKAILDAKNISNEEISYFIKHKKFLLPANKFEFTAFYPCADISKKFIDGEVSIKRDVEISSGYRYGTKVINGYSSSINNRYIRLILEELKGTLKKDTGWYYNYSNCIDINGKEVIISDRDKKYR